MSNPWLRKNPYLSLWLSGVNAIAGTARGHAGAQVQRQATKAAREMTDAVMKAWLAPFAPPAPRGRRRRR